MASCRAHAVDHDLDTPMALLWLMVSGESRSPSGKFEIWKFQEHNGFRMLSHAIILSCGLPEHPILSLLSRPAIEYNKNVARCHWLEEMEEMIQLKPKTSWIASTARSDTILQKKKSKKWKWSRWRNEGNLCNMHARISMVKISDVSVIYAAFFFMTGLGLTILKQHNPERKRVVSPRVPDRAWSPKHREQHPSVAISQKHWSPEVDKKWGQIKKWWADRLTVKLW